MKKITFFIFLFLILSYSALFSQNYFNTSNVTYVPLNASVCDAGYIYFGLEKISTNFLDIAVTSQQVYNNNTDHRIGHWNLNNGNGEFGSFNSFTPQVLGTNLIDNIFVKLRSNSSVKDLIICRDNGLQVHWNNNGGITGMMYNYYGGTNLKNFETGIFDMDDNSEDILASNGTASLFYFKNSNDGSISNYGYVNLPHSFTKFKIRQLNEKGEGYIQNNPNDRSDIIFLESNAPPLDDRIYAYLNNNNNGFESAEFANFNTDKPDIVALEVADLDGDGYNDIVVVCKDRDCGIQYNFRAYKNYFGYLINQSPIWSFETNDPEPLYGCGDDIARINVADINKDGLNDLVFSLHTNNIIRFKVFINHSNTSTSWYATLPEQSFCVTNEDGDGITPMKIITADLYGSQNVDGGGIALLVSYSRNLAPSSHEKDLHVDVFNASFKQTNPPPPILQRLVYYDQTNNVWHPWIHLDRRGERDFSRYDIYKYSPSHPLGIVHQGTEDDFIDYNECIDLTGFDNFFYNCYYYAKEVDNHQPSPNVSDPSKYAYYTVGCIPSCDGCGEDGPTSNPILNFINSNPPEKYTLSQNYPNPFNPSTSIHFTLPKAAKVKLTIYNNLGQIVRELVNRYYEAGEYAIQFEGKNLASGIYYYRFEAEGFTQTKKMLLLK